MIDRLTYLKVLRDVKAPATKIARIDAMTDEDFEAWQNDLYWKGVSERDGDSKPSSRRVL